MKSLFGNDSFHNKQKHIMGNMFVFDNNELNFTVENLKNIENKYTNPLANESYDEIPNDLIEFSLLYDEINKNYLKTKNENVRLLFKITLQGLTGAMNALHLNNKHIEINMKNMNLKNCLANREINQVYENTKDQFAITQIFTLAPLYSYYILLFGIPTSGFEPCKIQKIIDVLNQYGINPYQ
jgi:hypothetical protein